MGIWHHFAAVVNNAPQSGWLVLPDFAKFLPRLLTENRQNMWQTGRFVALLLLLFANPAVAQIPATAQEGGDFSFKRVGVPQKGTTKRITVQIDPNSEIYRITPGGDPRRPGDPRPEAAYRLPPGLVPEGPSEFDWYWEAVSPAINVDAATRFRSAMDTIHREALKIGTPRLQVLQRIIDLHGIDMMTSTIGTEVSPALVLAVISVESAGRSEAESHAGAQGLMQLMPDTAKRFGVGDSLDASQNIRGGVAYLDWLLKQFGRDPVLALAGYNAGEGAVTEYSGVPPYAETRAYVPKVLAAWNVARSLCLTPPELVSDGCVFVARQASVSGG